MDRVPINLRMAREIEATIFMVVLVVASAILLMLKMRFAHSEEMARIAARQEPKD